MTHNRRIIGILLIRYIVTGCGLLGRITGMPTQLPGSNGGPTVVASTTPI